MKPTTALLTSALLVISVASCTTTTRTVYVTEPLDCEVDLPTEPELPLIDRGHLWDRLGDEEYRDVERYINTLWGYTDELTATLNELCRP